MKKNKKTLTNIGLYYALSPKKDKKFTDALAFNELAQNQPLENKAVGYHFGKVFQRKNKK